MSQFGRLLLQSRITQDQFITLTGTSLRTIQRWRQHNTTPKIVIQYLKLLGSNLKEYHQDWTSWSINRYGKLCSPENMEFTPGNVRAIPFRLQQIRLLEVTVRKLRSELKQQHENATIIQFPTP